MNYLKIISTINLSDNISNQFIDGCYDNQYYYFLSSESNFITKIIPKIYCSKFSLNRCYKNITYDNNNNIFIALSDNENLIFFLNNNFTEIGHIKLNLKNYSSTDIINISFNSATNNIIINTIDGILFLEKTTGNIIKRIYNNKNSLKYYSSIILNPYIINLAKIEYKNNYFIEISLNNRVVDKYFIPSEILPVSILNVLYCSNCNKIIIYMLGYNLNGDPVLINSHVYLPLLKCSFNNKCCTNTQDHIAHLNCKKCICEKACNILDSIALIESSLSHILNAEGEKIQTGIKMSKNIKDLLEINDSINKTIINSINLEKILYYKLNDTLTILKIFNDKSS